MRRIRFRFTILRMMVALAIGTVLVVSVARAWERSRRLHALALERHAAALKYYKGLERLYPSEIPLTGLYPASRKLMEAESDLWGRSTAAKAHLGRWQKFEQMTRQAMSEHPTGCYSVDQLNELDFYVKEAEYWAVKEE